MNEVPFWCMLLKNSSFWNIISMDRVFFQFFLHSPNSQLSLESVPSKFIQPNHVVLIMCYPCFSDWILIRYYKKFESKVPHPRQFFLSCRRLCQDNRFKKENFQRSGWKLTPQRAQDASQRTLWRPKWTSPWGWNSKSLPSIFPAAEFQFSHLPKNVENISEVFPVSNSLKKKDPIWLTALRITNKMISYFFHLCQPSLGSEICFVPPLITALYF
jgi:hypothetical protein